MRYLLALFLLLIFGNVLCEQQLPVGDRMRFSKSLSVLPSGFYTKHLGFFCKQELQLQKRTNVNVFFRLGSKAHVDYLEQKPGARTRF